jgi:hypothetical protein
MIDPAVLVSNIEVGTRTHSVENPGGVKAKSDSREAR